MLIEKIEEEKDILEYLTKRNLLEQYKKAKKYLIIWNSKQIDFKIREPKIDEIYYFRINKQFIVLCYFEEKTLVVFKIDNHQK